MDTYFIAIDLGASSGRVILIQFIPTERIVLTEIHRFSNQLIEEEGATCWDIDRLLTEIYIGLDKVANQAKSQQIIISGIGIDSWGVDFVLIDHKGDRVGSAVSYRDARTNGVMERLFEKMAQQDIFEKTAIQSLTFNTLFQLKALIESKPTWLKRVNKLQLIPDYLSFKLTGVVNCEHSNASTTQLLNWRTGDWDDTLIKLVGIPRKWLPDVSQSCHVIGPYQLADQTVPVIAVASHDTASAIAAAPLFDHDCAYISSGTWSLMGIELAEPLISQQALMAGFTNEIAIDGRFRTLKNIMGLWLIQSVQRELKDKNINGADAQELSFAQLVAQAEQSEPFQSLINPNDPSFLNPLSMIMAIQDFCHLRGQKVPQTAGELARCIFDSLACSYKQVMVQLEQLTGKKLTQIHIFGGGCQNKLLNQLCADACQRPVFAGPVEASALGNAIGQLLATKQLNNLDEARQLISHSFELICYPPKLENQHYFEQNWVRFQLL